MNKVNATAARTVAQLSELYFEIPEATIDGVVCGMCSKHARDFHGPQAQVRHASVDHVRFCFATFAEMEAEAASERAAEAGVERFFEEGPNGPEDDPRERQLWAMEDYLQGR